MIIETFYGWAVRDWLYKVVRLSCRDVRELSLKFLSSPEIGNERVAHAFPIYTASPNTKLLFGY
jgi:hypothetical protein